LLAWADSNATLRLALRSPREALRSQAVEMLTLEGGPDNTAASSLPEPITPPAFAMGPPPPVGAPARASRYSSPVELIIGDQIVDPNGNR